MLSTRKEVLEEKAPDRETRTTTRRHRKRKGSLRITSEEATSRSKRKGQANIRDKRKQNITKKIQLDCS